jgi:hypothetical protein
MLLASIAFDRAVIRWILTWTVPLISLASVLRLSGLARVRRVFRLRPSGVRYYCTESASVLYFY